jgi:TfoX/Sxy family transcriptional regulator of competence genes
MSGSMTRIGRSSRKPSPTAAQLPKKGLTIDLAFWRVPERLFDEPDELVVWSRAALGAARRVAAKRGRAAPKRRA